MAQIIKNANIFGRVGTGIGKGLAEQVPKEIENYRLRTGLKSLADEADKGELSPSQYLAKAAGTYGVTPQMVQSFSELAKTQNQGNAFKRASGMSQNVNAQSASPGINDIRFGNTPNQQQGMQQQQGNMSPVASVDNMQRTPNANPSQDIPAVQEANALNKENLSSLPWTPEQRNKSISNYINLGFLPDQAKQLAADDETRDLSTPDVYKKRLGEIEEGKGKAREALTRHLETKLQKKGPNVFQDVEGPMLLNAERGMIRDLIQNPKADIDNVANDWSERLYRTAIAKGDLRKMGATTGFEALIKGESPTKALAEYQDIFKKSGNLEEFQNILRQKNESAQFDKEGNIISPEKQGLGLSDSASAFIAYPPNEKIAKYIKHFGKGRSPSHAALDVEKLGIGPDDSILAISKAFSDVDPKFNQQEFFDQISEDKNIIGLNDRQRLELTKGIRNILPNWADLLYLPIFRR